MANGDKAAARGWTTNAGTDDRRNGWDRINYALDRAAEQANRLDVVEAAVNQPIFAVRKSTATMTTTSGTWTPAIANKWAAPDLNTGFATWAGGQLTIAKAGVYRLAGHVQYVSGPFDAVGLQIVRNATTWDTDSTVVKGENAGRGADGSSLVRLQTGDVLAFLTMARLQSGSGACTVSNHRYDLAFSAEWVRD